MYYFLSSFRILWISLYLLMQCILSAAEIVQFLEPGFFFSYDPPDQAFQIPVTHVVVEQCETIHISWGRESAIGPNPASPYSLVLFTSNFLTPFIIVIDAGLNLEFDYVVPFAPGTRYQMCMFDSFGTTGGCQAIYTMIKNETVTDATDTCTNVTFPPLLGVDATVASGPMSQNGEIDQCGDITLTPTNGTPPYIVTISPDLGQPFNLTSNSMDPIVWTATMSHGVGFFISMISSEGYVWVNGVQHISGSGNIDCIFPSTKRLNAVAAGAAVGSFFAGTAIAATLYYLISKRWQAKREIRMETALHRHTNWDGSLPSWPTRFDSSPSAESMDRILPPLPEEDSTSRRDGLNQIYVMHHDGGRAPVTIFTKGGMDVVELPPDYTGVERQPEGDESTVGVRASQRQIESSLTWPASLPTAVTSRTTVRSLLTDSTTIPPVTSDSPRLPPLGEPEHEPRVKFG